MTQLRADFNVQNFEDYGTVSSYLSEEQSSQVALTTSRVNSQLDWIAQLLGWRGDGYWDGLLSTVSQKRRMLGGSYGVYNGFIYPRVMEIRNWENSIIIEADPRILPGLTLYLGKESYTPRNLTQVGATYVLSFDSLPDQFYTDVSNNEQIKVISPLALPAPFSRPEPGTSGDASFLCEKSGLSLVLYPSYNAEKNLPYALNTFITGCRYYFDKPVKLLISGSLTVLPEYDFNVERWYIEIPQNSETAELGLSATLSYEDASLSVSLYPWEDPSDWKNKNTIENFRGVWNNKGGKLPFHFVFDALEIHGFDERKSVRLKPVDSSVSFDQLLEFVYLKKAIVSSTNPTYAKPNQVWWNSQNGVFSVFSGDPLNCGPWAGTEINYPNPLQNYPLIDYVFPDVSSFLSYSDPIPEGCLVRINDMTGLSPSDEIVGLKQTLTGPGSIDIFKPEGSPYWVIWEIEINDEEDFSANCERIPPRVRVSLKDSQGLSPSTSTYKVQNLGISVEEKLPLLLMKESYSGPWYLSPPSNLRYIGNTRLFSSSEDYDNPTEGELSWDYDNPDPYNRVASVFYYNNWVQDPITHEWSLTGNWVQINLGNSGHPIPEVVNFGAILVYCDDVLLEDGVSYRTENFQFIYTTDEVTGDFQFIYTPITYAGTVGFPRITISDSLTTAFTHDISNLVFSGLSYYMSPNVLDSETLLRLWKSEPLSVIDSLNELELLRNSNPLRADINSGPSDENWERYFVRLPPAYGRNEAVWQKVNLVCQDFGYWGSPITPEKMTCPPEESKPRIYEQVHLFRERPDAPTYLYSEPYLYSDVVYGYSQSVDYGNSAILPVYDQPYDDFDEGSVVPYEPLHNRRADITSPVGQGYGEWEGGYYRAAPCYEPTGFLVNDLLSGNLEPISAPLWDASVYKLPPTCGSQQSSSTVDANHFKVGYAFFAADLSTAEDGVFDFASAG